MAGAKKIVHQTTPYIISPQHALFRIFVVRMVHSKQAKCLPDLLFLTGCYTILFGELGGALCDEGCPSRWCATLGWLFFASVISCL
jgi:hypothetical protein